MDALGDAYKAFPQLLLSHVSVDISSPVAALKHLSTCLRASAFSSVLDCTPGMPVEGKLMSRSFTASGFDEASIIGPNSNLRSALCAAVMAIMTSPISTCRRFCDTSTSMQQRKTIMSLHDRHASSNHDDLTYFLLIS